VSTLAVQGMKLGEMLESPGFRLFDAMSAIEIMDPKMDSGFNNSRDMTLEKAEDTGIISCKASHEELLGIWDQLLMYFLLWLEGHTIAQTCFCCLYLQDLKKLVKPVPIFGAFVDAFLVACRRARNAVLRAGVFDDEDFMPSLFAIDLEACVFATNPAEVSSRLVDVRKSLATDSSKLAEPLSWRLDFIGEYMLALCDLVDEAELTPNGDRAKHMENAGRRLTSCLGLIEKLDASAAPLPPGGLPCFDASINRGLLVPGPPRTVEPLADSRVAFRMWSSHIQELLQCRSLTTLPLQQLLEGGSAVARKVAAEPNILPRSVGQLCASQEGFVRKVMLDSLQLHLFPCEALQHCKRATDTFLAHSESLFGHLLKLAHANRARRFRRLAHVFTDFNALQHEAWRLDEDLKQTFGANLRHPRPCWVWIMEHCLEMMIAKLLLGFELDLYDQAELHMIYWYIDYLYGLRLYNLNELYHAKEQPVGGGKKKATVRQKDHAMRGGGLRPRNPPGFLLLLEATQSTVRGLFRLLAFCLRRDLLAAPAATTGGLAQRFVLRFRALEQFRLPHLPSYRDFEQSSASAQQTPPDGGRVVLDAAQASFADSAALLERLGAARNSDDSQHWPYQESPQDTAKALKRVVVANQLAVTKLMRALDSAEKGLQVEASPTHHPYLMSIRVTTA